MIQMNIVNITTLLICIYIVIVVDITNAFAQKLKNVQKGLDIAPQHEPVHIVALQNDYLEFLRMQK